MLWLLFAHVFDFELIMALFHDLDHGVAVGVQLDHVEVNLLLFELFHKVLEDKSVWRPIRIIISFPTMNVKTGSVRWSISYQINALYSLLRPVLQETHLETTLNVLGYSIILTSCLHPVDEVFNDIHVFSEGQYLEPARSCVEVAVTYKANAHATLI